MDIDNNKQTPRPTIYHAWDGAAWQFSRDLWLDGFVRPERDRRISAALWRVERYTLQAALGLATTDSAATYTALLVYIQALRDFPASATVADDFVDATNWPALPGN